jgi:hypothetical protein
MSERFNFGVFTLVTVASSALSGRIMFNRHMCHREMDKVSWAANNQLFQMRHGGIDCTEEQRCEVYKRQNCELNVCQQYLDQSLFSQIASFRPPWEPPPWERNSKR